MAVTKAGLVALALTTGCLRFGYGPASDPQPDAAQHDAGPYSHDGGTRDGGTHDGGTHDGGVRDAAVSGNAGMDGGAAHQPDAANAGSAVDAAAGNAGSSAAADSGPGKVDAAADDDDAGVVVIDDNPMIGDSGLRVKDVVGYYNSATWGDMLLQAHGTEIWASYPLNDGTIIGKVTSEGVLAGWWTETPSRAGRNAGEVELRWSQPNGKIHMAGRWRYQTSGSWVSNWNLDLVTDGSSPPSALVDAFNHPDNFKRHP